MLSWNKRSSIGGADDMTDPTMPAARGARPISKIEIRRVSKMFGEGDARTVEAIRLLDLRIEEGEIYCLLGPSGCGKTTALNLIAGFDQPTTGEVLVDGEPVTKPGPDRAVVFQQPTLYPWYSVLSNITLGPRLAGVGLAEARSTALRYIAVMGLTGFEDRYPYELSGGMQQRVALARAWVNTPRVLLLDEPFGALDAQTRIVMQELLLDLWERFKTTILFITHDVDEAIFLGDRIGVMGRRPGLLKEELAVNLRRPRTIAVTTDQNFVDTKRKILEHLYEEGQIR